MQDMSRVWSHVDREVAETPMPTEYNGLYRKILCKDCSRLSYAVFHIVGMKCEECGSYNTTPDKGPLLRLESGEGTDRVFTPLTDDEVEALSNIPIPENGSDDSHLPSDGDAGSEDGWETDEEVDEHVADEMVEEDLD